VYQLAQDKLNSIEPDIEVLKRTKRYVRKVLCDWEQRIVNAGSGEKSHLLYSLTDAVRRAGTPAKSVSEEEINMKTVIAFVVLGALQLTAQDMQPCPMH
jgi:hypothetical protein